MILESILAVVSSSGFGAITGGFFGWLNRKEDRKAREADQKHEQAMIGLRANANEQTLNAEAFVESQKTLSVWADAIKAVVRPAITAALMYMVYQILEDMEKLQINFATLVDKDPALAIDLYRQILLSIVSLTSMAVAWWFASRPTAISYQPRPAVSK